MSGATSLALAFSLSMDSFAAAVGCGAGQRRPCMPDALRVGAVFGGFQLALALLGWALGVGFAGPVVAVGHWIAFGLLLLIGGSMVRSALDGSGGGSAAGGAAVGRPGWLPLLAMAVATSLDAGAVGIGLAMADLDIVVTAALIGLVTFLMGCGGVLLGRAAGPWLGRWAGFAGGFGLIMVGGKILFEHIVA